MTLPISNLPLCICGAPSCQIAYGHCHCKCGRPTHIAKRNDSSTGAIKGMPRRYLRGHHWQTRPDVQVAAAFKIEGVYCRLIPLHNGMYTIVDAEDYEWLMFWHWGGFRYKQTFYAVRRQWIDGKKQTFYMHREILKPLEGKFGDHKSGVGLDNRRKNLRDASKRESCWNQRKRPSKSKFKGVRPHGKNFTSRITVDGMQKHLGSFAKEEDAGKAYREEAVRRYGEFARFD